MLRIRLHTPLLVTLMLVLLAAGVLSDCGGCKTKVNDFRVIRAEAANQIRELQGSIVFICPGESVTLGWQTEEADSVSIDNGVGPVQVPIGTTTIKPVKDTHYTLTAVKGECKESKSVDVFMITPGKTISATASLISRAPYIWEAKLLPQFYSPKMLTASARLSLPTTQQGWGAHKIDTDGSIHDFRLTPVFTSVGTPIPVAGTWQLSPVEQTEVNQDSPGVATIEMNVNCK